MKSFIVGLLRFCCGALFFGVLAYGYLTWISYNEDVNRKRREAHNEALPEAYRSFGKDLYRAREQFIGFDSMKDVKRLLFCCQDGYPRILTNDNWMVVAEQMMDEEHAVLERKIAVFKTFRSRLDSVAKPPEGERFVCNELLDDFKVEIDGDNGIFKRKVDILSEFREQGGKWSLVNGKVLFLDATFRTRMKNKIEDYCRAVERASYKPTRAED